MKPGPFVPPAVGTRVRYRKTTVQYGAARHLVRQAVRLKGAVTALDAGIPGATRLQVADCLCKMARAGELVRLVPATLGRNSKPAVYGLPGAKEAA